MGFIFVFVLRGGRRHLTLKKKKQGKVEGDQKKGQIVFAFEFHPLEVPAHWLRNGWVCVCICVWSFMCILFR